CLIRKNAWNKDLHSIVWCLERAKKWLNSVNSRYGFKPDEIIEENPAILQYSGQVVLPKEFTPPENLNTGEIILTQFKSEHYIFEQNILLLIEQYYFHPSL
ncbi:unnamed protein product, partial [marine sediment metagenome]